MKQFVVIVLLGLVALPALGQAQRYETGRRLRSFEAAWEEQKDAQARLRAVIPLKLAATSLFTGRPNAAARYLDEAHFALLSPNAPTDQVRWAQALAVYPETRLADPDAGEINCTIAPFYEAGKHVDSAKVFLTLARLDGQSKPVAIVRGLENLPLEAAIPIKQLTEGDYQLNVAIRADAITLAHAEQRISLVRNLTDRLNALQQAARNWPANSGNTDRESLRNVLGILHALAANRTLETDFPAYRLLVEAEAACAAIAKGERFYGTDRTGEFWLTLADDKFSLPARVFVPEEARKGKPLPVVVAVHGLGCSENMFFDSYGQGLIVKMCRERGWLLVAPRCGFQSVKVNEIVQEMARLYPVDTTKLFLVGHSMGAGQVVEAACATPEKFAGVAALGGGGSLTISTALKSLPFFVGIGKEDFAYTGGKNLAERLQNAGVTTVDYHEYDIEHLVVVQMAMRDVFAFFDAAMRK